MKGALEESERDFVFQVLATKRAQGGRRGVGWFGCLRSCANGRAIDTARGEVVYFVANGGGEHRDGPDVARGARGRIDGEGA